MASTKLNPALNESGRKQRGSHSPNVALSPSRGPATQPKKCALPPQRAHVRRPHKGQVAERARRRADPERNMPQRSRSWQYRRSGAGVRRSRSFSPYARNSAGDAAAPSAASGIAGPISLSSPPPLPSSSPCRPASPGPPLLSALGVDQVEELGPSAARAERQQGQAAGVKGPVVSEARRAARMQRRQRVWPHFRGRMAGEALV